MFKLSRNLNVTMSVWRTEEIMKLGIRVCSLRSLWKQNSILTTSVMDRSSLVHNQASRLTLIPLTGTAVTPVRFYSQESTHDLSSLLPTERQSSSRGEHQKRTSPYLTLLQQCASPTDVLDLTCRYAPTPRQIGKSIPHMWFCTKKMTEEQRHYELELMFQHPAFDPLLQNAMKTVGALRSEDLAYSLLSLVNLGVSQRSRVIQTFLRSCQEKVNNFDERGLSILSSCLHQMESSPNVSALKDGIRLVAENRLPQIQNVMALQTIMRLVGGSATPEFKRKLEVKALSMQDQFSLYNVQHMLSTMAAMELHSKPLLEVCSNQIRENLHAIQFTSLFKILQSYWELRYRDTALLTDISEYLVSVFNIWTNKQVILFLYMFENLGFCPDALMEAFAEKVMENPDALTMKDLLCILKVYSSLNYDLQHRRQKFLDSLSGVVESYVPKMSAFELLKSVYTLCLLNHLSLSPLELLLKDNMLEHLQDPSSKFIVPQNKMLRTVDLCLRLDHPPLPQSLMIPSSALEDPTLPLSAVSPLLSQSLQEMMEEQADAKLQEAVVVENFYFIDAVITKPLPYQSSVSEGGEESPAEHSHRVALLSVPLSHFCWGTSNPRGPLAAKLRHLRILGYEPVVLQEYGLHSLSPEKRTQLLRELIFPEHHCSDTNTE